MNKPLSQKELEGLINSMTGAVIRLSGGSEREFERLCSKLEALRLDTRPDLEVIVHAITAALVTGMPLKIMTGTFTALYGVDPRDLADAQTYAREHFPTGEFLS
jgi:hypothetical protein